MSDVFISYSRKDIAFARLLQESLQQSQIDTWIDWERIPVGERWWDEITSAIEQANAFMFIISRNSIGSTVCKDEINSALKNHKRIIPVVVDDLKPEAIREFAPELPQFNWIIFERDHIFQLEENPYSAADKPEDRQVASPRLPQFVEALEKLSRAIHTDWEWVKYHTRLQVDALRWESNQRNSSYLIRGTELDEAEQQLFRSSGKDPQPTSLQVDYVTASRQEETSRQQEKLQMEQKSRRRQQFALWAVGLGLLVAVVLGIVAWGQRNSYLAETHVRATAQAQAVSESQARATQEAIAISQKNEAERQARIALAGKLDTETTMLLGKQNDLALLLSVEGYNYDPGPQTSGTILNALLTSARLVRELHGTQAIVGSLAYSPDGKILATEGCGSQAEDFTCRYSETDLWDARTGQSLGKLTGDSGTAAAAGIVFSPDSRTLYTVSQLGNVVIWDLQTRQAIKKIRWHDKYVATTAFQPSGNLIALGECAKKVDGGIDAQISCKPGAIELWDMVSQQPVGQPLLGNPGVPTALAFSPNGKYLAAADFEHKLLLWDLQSSTSTKLLETDAASFVSDLAFSPDSSFLAVADSNNSVAYLSIPGNQPVFKSIQFTQLIASIALSPDGKTLAVSTFGSNASDEVTFWDVKTGSQIGRTLSGYSNGISKLVFSPDGALLAGGNKTVYIWDAKNPQILTTQPALPSDQRPLAIRPDGGQLVFGSDSSNSLDLWDVNKQKLVAELEPLTAAAEVARYSPAGDRLFTFGAGAGLAQWDAGTGALVGKTINQYTDQMYHATFSPGAALLATNLGTTVHLWDANSGELKGTIFAGMDELTSVAFSADGAKLALGGCVKASNQCTQGQAMIFSTSTQTKAARLQTGLADDVWATAFSPDGNTLATVSHTSVQLWNLSKPGTALKMVELPKVLPAGVHLDMYTLSIAAFSPDGKILAVGQQIPSRLFLFSVPDLKLLAGPLEAGSNLRSLLFTPDGRRLAAASDAPILIDLTDSKYTPHPLTPLAEATLDSSVDCLAISPDGRLLASGTWGAEITVWDISGPVPQKLASLTGHAVDIATLGFSKDGKILISASRDMTLDRWDVTTWALIDQPMKGYRENTNPTGAISPDGQKAATASCRIQSQGVNCSDSEIDLWNTGTGELLSLVHVPYRVFALAFSPDGHWLAEASGVKRSYQVDKGSVEMHLWDLTNTPPTSTTILSGMDTPFKLLSFNPSGKTLAGLLENGKLDLLNFPEGTPLDLPAPLKSGSFSSLAFSQDGQTLALGSSNGIQLYDLNSGQTIGPQISDLTPGLAVNNSVLLFSPDGKTLFTGEPLTAWNVDPAAWAALACQIVRRNLTQEEWATYLGEQPYHPTCPDSP